MNMNKRMKNKIDALVCQQFGLTKHDLKLNTRKREIVIPRQICMWLYEMKTTESLKQIGLQFNKHHASVIHAKRSVQDLIHTKNKYGIIANEILNQIMEAKEVTISMQEVAIMYRSTQVAYLQYQEKFNLLTKQEQKYCNMIHVENFISIEHYIQTFMQRLADVSHGDIVLVNHGIEVKRVRANYIKTEQYFTA